MGIILQPFALLLLFFYNLFNSYGIALILFAIVIKLILFPVTLKSKKSMIQTTMLSGKMQQLQKQYGKDRERYNLEVQKLYEREKVNPMGGCLWSLVPMIVLIALYGIIREPLTYFMHLTGEQIQVLAAQLDWETLAVANGWVSQDAMNKLSEKIAESVSNGEMQVFLDGLWKDKNGGITGLFQNGSFNQMYLLSQITSENLSTLQGAINAQFAGAGDGLFILDFNFLGINLSEIPTPMFWKRGLGWDSIGLFLLPIVSVVVSFLSMKVTMATNQMNSRTENSQVDKTNKMMMWTMPLMSLWIGFTIPAGLSVYWIAQYFVTMAQEVICGKMLKKDYEAALTEIAAKERALEEALSGKDIDKQLNNLNLEAMRLEISRLQALVDKYQKDAVDTEIPAKVSGIISAVNVTAGKENKPGEAMAVIDVIDRGYTIKISVTAEQAKQVKVGDTAEVTNFYWGSDITATLEQITPDPANPGQNKLLVFRLTGEIDAGTNISLSIGQRSSTFNTIVPKSALRQDTNGSFVLVITSRNTPLGNRYTATRVDVQVLAEDDTSAAVTGIAENDYVITTSSKPLAPGTQVRMVENP